MNYLPPPQIKGSCKLMLPEGLKELMSDITREVLRAQPEDMYNFISNYLSTMLVTRDNIAVACSLCDLSECECMPELYSELLSIGLDEIQANLARDIILKHIERGQVKEGNILMKLMRSTTIDEEYFPAIQIAVRLAYIRHKKSIEDSLKAASDKDQDEVKLAVKHTLELYKNTKPEQQESIKGSITGNMQVANQEYGVTRNDSPKGLEDLELAASIPVSGISVEDKELSDSSVSTITSWCEDPEFNLTSVVNKTKVHSISSTNIAGSITGVPKYVPYSIHTISSETTDATEELEEKEHVNIDYTNQITDYPKKSRQTNDKKKKISFEKSPAILGLENEPDRDSDDEELNKSQSIEGTISPDKEYRSHIDNFHDSIEYDEVVGGDDDLTANQS